MSTDNAPIDVAQEKDGEAVELVRWTRAFSVDLDAGTLKAAALRQLKKHVNRLIEISEERESRRQRIEELQTQLRDWQQENSVTLVTAPIQLKEILEELGERIDIDGIDQEGLDIVLDECSKVLNRHKQIIELQENLDQANKEEDFTRTASLSNELSSIKKERDSLCEQVQRMVDSLERSGRNSSLEKPKAQVGAGGTATDIKKGHEQQKNDPIATSQPESHQEIGANLEPETDNASKSILDKKQIGHSFPDDSKDAPPREEDSEEPSKDRSSQDEGVAPVSITSEQPDSIDETPAVSAQTIKRRFCKLRKVLRKRLNVIVSELPTILPA